MARGGAAYKALGLPWNFCKFSKSVQGALRLVEDFSRVIGRPTRREMRDIGGGSLQLGGADSLQRGGGGVGHDSGQDHIVSEVFHSEIKNNIFSSYTF